MQEPPPQPDQVLRALQALYTGTGEERKVANLFLVRLTERAASVPWDLLWSLLRSNQPEGQFCGAQLLIEKLQRTWDLVPTTDRRAVGQFLLQEVLQGQRTPLVSRCLTRSLCIYCLYDLPDPLLGSFDAILNALAHRLTTGESISYLLDFLTMLPLFATTAEFPIERRRRAISFVATRSLNAIEALLVVLRAAGAANREDQGAIVLKALASWFSVEAAGNFLWTSYAAADPGSAVSEALQWLARPAILAKEGAELVLDLLDHPALPSYPRAFFRLLGTMVDAAQLHIRNNVIEPVAARALSTIYCEIGTSFARALLTATAEADIAIIARYFQVFGSLTAHRDLEISALSFAGWEEIFDSAASSTPSPLLNDLIRPCCQALLELMFTQVRHGPGRKEDDIQRYRDEAMDTLLAGCYSLLGNDYARICWAALQAAAAAQPPSEEAVEAAVYLLGAVHEQISDEAEEVISKVASLYTACAPTATQLRKTLLWFIVVYADPVAKGGEAATRLLLSLVSDSVNPQFTPLHRNIIEVVYSLCCAHPAAFTSTTELLLSCVDRVALPLRSCFVDAIVALIPSHQPAERERYMSTLATPIVERVLASANAALERAPSSAELTTLSQEIGLSGSLMQYELPDPGDAQYMLRIFASLWPTLHRVLNTFAADEHISKALCMWIQFSVTSLRRHLSAVLVEMLGDLCVAFNALPASNAIYALDRTLDVCLQVRSSPLAPLPAIEMAIALYVQRASVIPIADLLADVTLCLALFFLARNLVKLMPTLFCSTDRTTFPPTGRALFRLALSCLATNDASTGKFVLLFLQSLCVLQSENSAIVTIAGACYGELLRALVQATVTVPRLLLVLLGDALFAMNNLNPTVFAAQMQALLSEPGFPSDTMRTESKLQWARSLSRSQKDNFRRLVSEFGNTIREGHEIGRFGSTAAPA